MRVGRNDPCPCGSGLKYKNCHLRSEQPSKDDRLWLELHELTLRLPAELMQFATSQFGPRLVDEAWHEFTLFKERAFDQESIHLPVFVPWFLYEWDPDPTATSVAKADLSLLPVASGYLSRRLRYGDPLLIRYLEACRDSAFSFLDVVDVTPGSGMLMRDILTGWQGAVVEKTASQTLRKGDILFAKAVTVDDVTILDGCAPIGFPPLEKGAIIELRKHIAKSNAKLTPKVLKDFRLELLEVYHAIADRLLHPRKPDLENTDGDPFMFCRVTYEVPSAREAFDMLRHLSLDTSEAELLADAQFGPASELTSVTIPWLRKGNAKFPWDNTILGQIHIDGRRILVEVNSEKRAASFRAIADKLLPAGSRYLSTVIESMEAALETYVEDRLAQAPEDDQEQRPELEALRTEYLRDYYRAWPDMKVPALNGRTPRQAMRTRDGREMVEALLLDLERRGDTAGGVDQSIMAELRATLQPATGRTQRVGPRKP